MSTGTANAERVHYVTSSRSIPHPWRLITGLLQPSSLARAVPDVEGATWMRRSPDHHGPRLQPSHEMLARRFPRSEWNDKTENARRRALRRSTTEYELYGHIGNRRVQVQAADIMEGLFHVESTVWYEDNSPLTPDDEALSKDLVDRVAARYQAMIDRVTGRQ